MLKAGFEENFQAVLLREGGLSTDRYDPGGITKFGISRNAFPDMTEADISALTTERARQIYKAEYWDKGKCGELNQAIAWIHFDSCVNHGILQATYILQKALKMHADGIMGKITVGAANNQNLRQTIKNHLSKRILFVSKSNVWDRYKEGWVRRYVSVAFDALMLL